MADQGKFFKKILYSKITLFLLLLAFLWLIVNLANVFYRKYKINKELADFQAEIQKAQQQNKQITQMIEYLGSQGFLEKEAREKLNMKKEGEEVVIIEMPKEIASTTEIKPEEKKEKETPSVFVGEQEVDSNLVKWWKYFFK